MPTHWITVATLAILLGGCVERVHVAPPIEVCRHIKDMDDQQTCEDKVRELAKLPAEAPSSSTGQTTSFPFSAVVLWWAVYYGFGLLIARFVYVDARTRAWLVLRIKPLWWAAICVVDPAFGLLCYWLVHYSRLVPRYPSNSAERPLEPA
jgi:hypothetical protein